MARPTTPPTNWASTGSKIAPSAGKIAAGWTVNERPPAEWINYLDAHRDEWLAFLKDISSGQPIVDLLLNFANTDMFAALLDVTTTPPASGYRLVARINATATTKIRMYAGNANRRLVFTNNAVWGGSSWVCELTSATATAVAVLNDGTQNTLELLWHAATAGTWSDSAWGRGNALLNSFAATGGTFTDLTVTNDLTVQRDAHVTRDLTVGRDVAVTNDITAREIRSLNMKADQLFPNATSQIALNGLARLNYGAAVSVDNLYLDSTVDIVHAGALSALPTRFICLDISRGKQWAGSAATYEDGNGRWVTTPSGGTGTIEFPLEVHRGTQRVSVRVVWEAQAVGDENRITLVRWAREFIIGMSLTPPGGWQAIGATLVQGSMPASSAVCETAAWDYAFDPTLERYAFVLEMADGTRNRVYAVRYQFSDPGPRNG